MDKLGVDSHHISPSNISHRHTNTQPPTESIHTKTKKLIKYLNQTWCVGEGWCKLSMFVASLASSHRQKEPVQFYWSQWLKGWAVICFLTSAHWWTIDMHRVDPPHLSHCQLEKTDDDKFALWLWNFVYYFKCSFPKMCFLQKHQLERELHSILLLVLIN